MAAELYRLDPLKTLHETRSTDEFVEAFVVEIPATLANKALGIVKPIFPTDRSLSFAHLRRVVTLTHLPLDLTWRRDYDSNGLNTVFLLLPDTPAVPWFKICQTLSAWVDVNGLPRCFNAVVPRNAPLSIEQANLWTERYWPTHYNPASQLVQDAPPLNQLRRVQTELETTATVEFMQIARTAAQESQQHGHGRASGAVIVNPKTGLIIAVAGDARWWTDEKTRENCSDFDGEGRPEHHALMRAVAMVANKELRRRLRNGQHLRFASTCQETPAGLPLTDVETLHADDLASPSSPGVLTPTSPTSPPKYSMENMAASMAAVSMAPLTRATSNQSSMSSGSSTGVKPDGYLCSGLDIYLTSEPCVCCAMAMIHSRFRACVFEKRMPGTGALTARDRKDSLGYGLFWRRELNWRVMTFKYEEEKDRGRRGKTIILEKFHA